MADIDQGEGKSFPTLAAATLATGTFMGGEFSTVHEAAEWLMGFPVWTHELPSLGKALSQSVCDQVPGMPSSAGESWERTRDLLLNQFGDTVVLLRGNGKRDPNKDPLTTAVAAMAGHDARPDEHAVECCTTCDVALPHGYTACDETMGHYCEACWPQVVCDEKHGEGCATFVFCGETA